MTKDKYALLVIDMQLVAFDGKITPPISNGTQLLKSVSGLIEFCRSIEIPIVYLQTCALSGQPYARDTHGWEIHPELGLQANDTVVHKVQSSGFEGTDLQDVLTALGVNTLISCGTWSEYCVTATSRDAIDLGYRVLVAADGHGTAAASHDEARETVAKQNKELTQHDALVIDIAGIKSMLVAA